MTKFVEDYNEDGTVKTLANGRHVWVEKHLREFEPQGHRTNTRATAAHMVMGDIDDYQSTITGEKIHGRAHHKRHLKQHGCVEVGGESLSSHEKNCEKPKLSRRDVQRDVQSAVERLS